MQRFAGGTVVGCTRPREAPRRPKVRPTQGLREVRPLGFEPRTCGLRAIPPVHCVQPSALTCAGVEPSVHPVLLRLLNHTEIRGGNTRCLHLQTISDASAIAGSVCPHGTLLGDSCVDRCELRRYRDPAVSRDQCASRLLRQGSLRCPVDDATLLTSSGQQVPPYIARQVSFDIGRLTRWLLVAAVFAVLFAPASLKGGADSGSPTTVTASVLAPAAEHGSEVTAARHREPARAALLPMLLGLVVVPPLRRAWRGRVDHPHTVRSCATATLILRRGPPALMA